METISVTPLLPDIEPVRLTQQVKAGGCASKLAPGILSKVLSNLPRQENSNVLVGFDTADDAGVYRISAHQALVQTVDFFTPMVDDPYIYGRIAATNALSDVYAMGGEAVSALALVCFPPEGNLDVLESILRGGLSVMQEAGCAVVGGHSVRDSEIKFGYAVTGLIHPDRIFTNTGAEPGDALVFTKALGTGVITTALKQQKADPQWVEAAIGSMTLSNRRASAVAVRSEFQVHAMTDVTGFGLIGHARELALGSQVRLRIDTRAIHAMDGAVEAIRLGCVPGGLLANREFAECFVEQTTPIPGELLTLLYDPQTAGGLLMSVARDDADALVQDLRSAGYPHSAIIGAVLDGTPKIELAR